MKFWFIFGISFLISGILHGIKSTPQEATIAELELVLQDLAEYDFGEPETWKPDWIDIMKSIYGSPEVQEDATEVIERFLKSNASRAAKKAVSKSFYHLSSESYQETGPDSSHRPSPSQQMDRVASLREDFKSSIEPAAFIQRKLDTAPQELLPHIIRLVKELPDSFSQGSNFFENQSLDSIHKAQLLRLLAKRKDSSIHGLANQYASSGDPTLQRAGLTALQQIGNATDVSLLFDLAASKDESIATLARDSLHKIPGTEVDESIVSHLQTTAPIHLEETLLAIEKRNISGATVALLDLASKNPETRPGCLRSLSIVAPVKAIAPLAELLVQADSKKQRKEIETTLYRIAARFPEDPNSQSNLRKMLESSTRQEVKASLKSVLDRLNDTTN